MPVNYISPVERIYFDSLTLDPVNYQVINNYGFEGACAILRIVNESDANIVISYDGVTDHDYVQDYSHMTLNFQFNSQVNGNVSLIKKWSHVYVRGASVPKIGGYIYLTGYYQPII